MKSIDELPERIHAKIRVNQETGCWEWIGYIDRRGYGVAYANKKAIGSHRFVYESLAGRIPDGLECDHLCRNRRCCNPAHIEPVTPVENTMRGNSPPAVWARTTVCPKCEEAMEITSKKKMCRNCYRIRKRTYFKERYQNDPAFRQRANMHSRNWKAKGIA